ncbi:MAG: YjfB family protein [Lachnospiraceae bacterium]|nr:YjfB family protein [Lachnospiraceae bacterium]
MDIAGLSMDMYQTGLMNKVGIAVLSNQLDMNETLGQSMVAMMDRSMMEQSVAPHIGSNFDMSV